MLQKYQYIEQSFNDNKIRKKTDCIFATYEKIPVGNHSVVSVIFFCFVTV